MKYLLFLFLLLNGCADLYDRQYNNDDLQDQDCYARFGGLHGYCDK